MGGPIPELGPLEDEADLYAWLTFVQETEATIPFADSTGFDATKPWSGSTPVSLRTTAIADYNPGVQQLVFNAAWEKMLPATFVDPVTGVTVPLDAVNSPVVPVIEDPVTHTWVVNPAYVTFEQDQLAPGPQPSMASVPAPDPDVVVHGTGPYPTWGDIYLWQANQNAIENAKTSQLAAPTQASVANAVNVGMGTTTKALGGLISQVGQSVTWLARATQTRIDGIQLALFNVASNLNARLVAVEAVQRMILYWAIPSLQAQILKERKDRVTAINQAVDTQKTWTVDHIRDPLRDQVAHEVNDRKAGDQSVLNQVPDIVRSMAPELLAGGAAGLAALGARVKTLEDDAEKCGKPMCQTMGPTTPLGKFLKALKIAEWLALLAELAALRADGLDGLLIDIEGWAKTAIGDFESVFFSGGKTLGETITGIV